MPRAQEPGRSVSSRLWDLLYSFDTDHTELSLADLVRRTGMPHATARRLTLDLLEAGALERTSGNRFAIGLPLWRLGTLAPRAETLRSAAQPFVEDLYTALRQHVQLAVLQGDQAVIIERLSAVNAVGLTSQVGGLLPLHCSGVGKVLLSHSSPAFIDEVLAGRLQRFTPRTIVDPAELRRELASCRATGTVVVKEELSEGAESVATRIVDGSGNVVAAMSVVVAAGSIKLQAAVPTLVASGLGLSRSLGWRPGIPVRAA
ncbi:IclR family transcriptional regulator [Streptomyces sp. NPDC001178]|uniref:Pca regulon regulatory protein n=1 Tax=Streptomyces griseorubiginosus TaxID=67304 RepID=A0AAI8KUK9_9ACTN|nr:IclR family transcriptional regulator [Streptomyces griseorubiginosus]AYC35834.1 Pca regulon regulatory protein [Streptomyces griseorubiginosus]